jgi:hypothetical protein
MPVIPGSKNPGGILLYSDGWRRFAIGAKPLRHGLQPGKWHGLQPSKWHGLQIRASGTVSHRLRVRRSQIRASGTVSHRLRVRRSQIRASGTVSHRLRVRRSQIRASGRDLAEGKSAPSKVHEVKMMLNRIANELILYFFTFFVFSLNQDIYGFSMGHISPLE